MIFFRAVPELGAVTFDPAMRFPIWTRGEKVPVPLHKIPKKSWKMIEKIQNASSLKWTRFWFFHETTGFWKYFSSYTWVRGCNFGVQCSIFDVFGPLESCRSYLSIAPKIIKISSLSSEIEHSKDALMQIFLIFFSHKPKLGTCVGQVRFPKLGSPSQVPQVRLIPPIRG